VRVEVSIDSARVEVCVVDQGSGFDPEAVPDPTMPENLEHPGGRGLFLIRQLMDEVEYNERGNAVRLLLRREPPKRRRSSRA
jgi:serine/threonine-protein kinase RsbW